MTTPSLPYRPRHLGQPLNDPQTVVLGLVAQGLTYDAIARRMGCSHETVKRYMRELRAKLGAPNVAAAVDRGWRAGYLPIRVEVTPRQRRL